MEKRTQKRLKKGPKIDWKKVSPHPQENGSKIDWKPGPKSDPKMGPIPDWVQNWEKGGEVGKKAQIYPKKGGNPEKRVLTHA